MAGDERNVWLRLWAAIEDGDEPIESIPGSLAEINRRLDELTQRLKPQLEPRDLECLSGVSLALAALELAMTGERVHGRDTYLALTFKPRRKNRVRQRQRERQLSAASTRRGELLDSGLKAREADKMAAKAFGVNRTYLREWEADLERLLGVLGASASEE
jgi:hypothetical protein